MRSVVIFAKAPVLGTVKTRLAQTIGDEAALGLYRKLLARTIDRLSGQGWVLALAVTPDESADQDDLWPRTCRRIGQGGGDLGERMLRILRTATAAAPVVIVGSDVPGLCADHVKTAFDALGRAGLVFGPAEDGGFYLVGASRPPSATIFDGVRWSNASTFADVTANLLRQPALIAPLADLDDVASLERHRADGTI